MGWHVVNEGPGIVLSHGGPALTLGGWGASLHHGLCRTAGEQADAAAAARSPSEPRTLALQVGASPTAGAAQLGGEDELARAELTLVASDELARLQGTLLNRSACWLRLERLVITVDPVSLGTGAAGPGRFSFYKNGHQSWTASHTFSPGERELVPRLGFARRMQENLRSPAAGRPGGFGSELYALLGNLDEQVYLLAGQQAGFSQWAYQRVHFDPATGRPRKLELELDFGGRLLAPGGSVALDPLCLLAGEQPCRLLDAYLACVQQQASEPGSRVDGQPACGWCSWYYYGPRVTARDVAENLDAAMAHPAGWDLFMLDDGWQTDVGDWLTVNDKFPDGLAGLATRIREAGMRPGLWLAPFLARKRSRVGREHPEWFLSDARGRPVSAGYNPLWGLDGRCLALDTTHPGFQQHLRQIVRTLVHEWGFGLLKLDFLYAAAQPGLAHDPTLSPAQRLALGYDLIREEAGPDVVLLGCGAPLGPSIGRVDVMRIGPDVAPYWFPTLRYHLTSDPHALSACFAIRSTLNRAPLHRRLWLNDPDCLLLRDSETRLSPAERQTLASAIAISGGLLLLSDRLGRLAPHLWQRLEQVRAVSVACARGTCWALDFMERPLPEIVYNSAGYLAIFNFTDRPAARRVAHRRWLAGLVPEEAELRSVWEDGKTYRISAGHLDLGTMQPHSSILLRWDGEGERAS